MPAFSICTGVKIFIKSVLILFSTYGKKIML